MGANLGRLMYRSAKHLEREQILQAYTDVEEKITDAIYTSARHDYLIED